MFNGIKKVFARLGKKDPLSVYMIGQSDAFRKGVDKGNRCIDASKDDNNAIEQCHELFDKTRDEKIADGLDYDFENGVAMATSVYLNTGKRLKG